MQYTPSQEIAAIAERSKLSQRGERFFYASTPELDGTQEFSDKCISHETSSAILGCYTGGKIYLFDVSAEELDGIKEVTAAHEMLHAAYDRLSRAEKSRVSTLLEREATRLTEDKEFRERMSVYDDVSADERLDELHSILATEIADLPDELEQYYDQYFINRSAVVVLYKQYSSVFFQLEQQSEQLQVQLERLSQVISSGSTAYEQARDRLRRDIASFNQRAESGRYSTQTEFARDRASLQTRQAELERQRQQINSLVERYNQQVAQLNAIGGKINSLSESLDSRLAPPPAV
jgi:chromosome segregation ATPase